MMRHFAGLAGIAALALTVAAPAQADDPEMESIYSGYHRAISAATQCDKRDFDQSDHEKMSIVIDEAVHHAIGAGRRLTLIEQAKSEIRDLVKRKGCDEPTVRDALALFYNDLEPALQ